MQPPGFPGAASTTSGLFGEAEGGTLLLDEIGEMPLALQAKLLRVLQEGEVRRVGEARARPVDVRILSATHRDLRALVASGRFREETFSMGAGSPSRSCRCWSWSRASPIRRGKASPTRR